MPSLDMYKHIYGVHTDGQARKVQSDSIIEASWYEDINSKRAYIYDYYHDDEPLIYTGMHPERSKTKCPIDIKFILNTYNSENKDVQGFHVQFKPSFNWHKEPRLHYYKEVFEDKYSAEFPIGLMLDIWDDTIHTYRKWLIVEYANTLAIQFPTWYILPMDHLFQWIVDGKMYQMCGVSRSQNS